MANTRKSNTKRTTTRRRRRKQNLSGIDSLKKVKTEAILSDSMKAGTFILGMFAGKKVIVALDKKINQSGTNGVLGIFGFEGKKAIAPLVVGAGGLVLSQLTKDPRFKQFGLGLTGVAGVEAVKTFFNKDILAGLGSDDTTMLPGIGAESVTLPKLSLDNEAATRASDAIVVEGEKDNMSGEYVGEVVEEEDIEIE